MTTAQVAGRLIGNAYVEHKSIEDARKRDEARALEDQFDAVVEEFSDLAYNVAIGMLHSPEDAQDAVQEAFVSAYRAFPKFKGDSKVSTWLYRIVVNACLMKIRKEKTRNKYLTQTGYDDAIVYDWAGDPVRAAENGELQDAIRQGLEQLSPDLKAAVVLRDLQELTNEEASEIIGIGVAAFKSRVHRGRTMLRKNLESYLTRRNG